MQVGSLLLFEVEHHGKGEEVGDLVEGVEAKVLAEFAVIEGDVELFVVDLQAGTGLQLVEGVVVLFVVP